MIKQFSLTTTINQAAPIFGAAALSGLAMFAMPGVAQAADIGAGIDNLVTPPLGTSKTFIFGGSTAVIQLKGAGGADTWIERKGDCDFDDEGKCHVDIEVIKLDLISVDTVNIGGFRYDVDIDLFDQDRSVGEMWINDDGTFTADFVVHSQANLIALDGGADLDPIVAWDDFTGGGAWKFDANNKFIYDGQLVFNSGNATHVVVPVPEPLTTLASVTGLAFGGILKRKNDKKNKKQQKA